MLLLATALTACRTEEDLFANLQKNAGATARYSVDKSSADKWILRIVVTDVAEPKRVGSVRTYLIGHVATESEKDLFQASETRAKRWYRGWEDDLSGGVDVRRDDLVGWVLDYELNFNFDKQPGKPKSKSVSAVTSAKSWNQIAQKPEGIRFVHCEGAQPYC